MDGQRFDAFARSLALATDRRRFLKVLTAGISIAIMDRLGVTGQSKLAESPDGLHSSRCPLCYRRHMLQQALCRRRLYGRSFLSG